MKTTLYLNSILWQSLVASFIIVCTSCSHYPKTDELSFRIQQDKEASLEFLEKENDKQFLINATEIALEEIKLGQLAQYISQKQEVKALGKMMEKIHCQSLKNLIVIAKKKSIDIPTALSTRAIEKYKKLSRQSKNDFDLIFCNTTVMNNEDAIASFEKVSIESNDLDMIQWATITLPALRNNLNQAITCKRKARSAPW